MITFGAPTAAAFFTYFRGNISANVHLTTATNLDALSQDASDGTIRRVLRLVCADELVCSAVAGGVHYIFAVH